MVAVDQWVAQLVVLIGKLDGRLGKDNALLHAVALGKGAGGNIPDDNLQRNDGSLLHQGLPVGQLLHQVGGNALLLQQLHHVVGNPVVDGALTGDGSLLQAVERSRVVLVGHQQDLRIVRSVHALSLAFVEHFFLFHGNFPPEIL